MNLKNYFKITATFVLFLTPTPIFALDLSSDYAPAALIGGNSVTLADFVAPLITNAAIFAGVLAFFMVIFAGFRFITSSGNPQESQKAISMLTYALIGMALAALAFLITRILFTVGGFGPNFF